MMKTLRRLVFALYALFAAAIPAYADVVWFPTVTGNRAVLIILVLLLLILTGYIVNKFKK